MFPFLRPLAVSLTAAAVAVPMACVSTAAHAATATETFTVSSRIIRSTDVGRRLDIRVLANPPKATIDCSTVQFQVGGSAIKPSSSYCDPDDTGWVTQVTESMVGKSVEVIGDADAKTDDATVTGVITIGLDRRVSIVQLRPKAPDTAVYVSPWGSGTACTVKQPCAVDDAVTARGKATYKFLAGQYRRSTPITLTKANEGSTFEAADPEKATVIDGSKQIMGWSAYGTQGIMRAQIPKGSIGRSLYINDKPATLATMKAKDAFGTMTKTATGFTTSKPTTGLDASAELQWAGPNTSNVAWELWVDRHAPVTASGTNTLTVPTTAWRNLQPTAPQGVNLPSSVANTLWALKGPGQFVVDSANGYLYYWPRSGENLSTAQVDLPSTVSLFKASGVDGITIKNLRFTKDTYNEGADGFADGQATVRRVSSGASEMTTATIDLRNTHRSVVDSVWVDRSGAAGIGITGASSDNTVKNSTVTLPGATGIQVGDITNSSNTDNQRFVVERNHVDNTGQRYKGGVGIFAGYVKDSSISHNTITATSYSGISLGWGWGAPSNMGGNRIASNRITDSMVTELVDGGAIYVNGTTDKANRSSITENRIDRDHQPHGAIYLDGSASNWNVSNNVVTNVVSGTAWLFLQSIGDQASHGNIAWDNWVQNGWVNDDNYGNEVAPADNQVLLTHVASDPVNINDWTRLIDSSAGA